MRLLLVEDDDMLGGTLKRGLTQAGHAVEWVQDGEAALLATDTSAFDLMLLDVNLPKLSGIDVVRRLRQSGNNQLPVLMLTAMDALDYKVKGLDSGADDYLTKPFDLEELLARIRSLTRRAQERSDALLRCGDIELNPHSRTVIRAGSIGSHHL
jgi:DNA-binding response OmpR family regulator